MKLKSRAACGWAGHRHSGVATAPILLKQVLVQLPSEVFTLKLTDETQPARLLRATVAQAQWNNVHS